MYYYTLVVLAYATFLLDNFNVRNKEKYSCLFAYVFFSVIFFISSFRYEVGSDYPGYKEIFEYDDPIEPLFASSQHKVKENSYCRHLSLMRTVINESNIQYFYGYGFNVFGG